MGEVPAGNPLGLPELAFDERFFRAPQATLGELRAGGARAAFVPRMGTIMLLGYADVYAALLDHDLGAMAPPTTSSRAGGRGPTSIG